MSPKRSAALLSLVGVGQSLTNIWAARADQQQAEINQAWAAVEAKMQEAALNRQYIADAAEYEARAAANGHSYGNYAGHRLQLNTNRQKHYPNQMKSVYLPLPSLQLQLDFQRVMPTTLYRVGG